MYFNTFLYPFFLFFAVTIFWLTRPRYRNIIIVFFSLFFYAFTSFAHLFLIIGLAVFVFAIGIKMQNTIDKIKRKRYFYFGIASILLVLAWFKYNYLFIGSIASLLSIPIDGWIKIVMPLGISFFTFEFIHYLIELHFNHIPSHTVGEFFTFAFFFPTLTSGPIKRFQTFIVSLRENMSFSLSYIYTGVAYILCGYAEKYLLADNLVSRTSFLANPTVAPSTSALLSGLFIYSFRLYFDFAGLSNVAIGSALLFGIKVPLNFDRPFIKSDLAAFWRSWHMSLTSWVRDYVYMPLVFKFRNNRFITIFGLVLTMGLVGLWHGASWNFLAFGMYHGIGLASLQFWRGLKIRKILPPIISKYAGMVATFVYVSLGWGFFVTHSLSDSILIYKTIFGKFI
jgi:alginate O-acetyltransferase complex protein AlgI